MNYLNNTGIKRFDSILKEFTNDWYQWRVDFNNKAKEGQDKHLKAIEDALEAKNQWVTDFAIAAQDPSKKATLSELYNRIQGMITEIESGLPNGISSGINANDILSKYRNSIPSGIDKSWIESAANVNTDFFLTRIAQNNFNAKDVMDDFALLQEEVTDRLAVLAKIQSLQNVQLYSDQYADIINGANKGLLSQLDSEMGGSGFLRAGDKYVKVGQSGMIHAIRTYKDFKYEPIPIPNVRDSQGKQWDLTNMDALLGEDGPKAKDIEVMAKVAMDAMDHKFKEIYDPEKPITYETPSEYSAFRQAMAGSSFLSGQSQGMELDITKYYLVGEVVGGSFGKHHHEEFWDIMTQKEKLGFLDQVVVKDQERKAKKRQAREGTWETVAMVVAVVGASILTGGAALTLVGPLMTGALGAGITIAAGAAVGGYVAYQGYKGYQMGGEKGAALALGSAALSMYTGPVSIGGSYSYEQGFGVSVGYSITGDNKTPLGNIGLNYTEQGGFGVSAGINISPNVGLNANINQSGAWGVGASINQVNTYNRQYPLNETIS